MKIKPFEFKAKYPIRAPEEHEDRLNADTYSYHYINDCYEQNLNRFKHKDPALYEKNSRGVLHELTYSLYTLHSRGDPLNEITERVVEAIECAEYKQKEFADVKLFSGFPTLNTWGPLAICLLLIPDSETMSRFSSLIKFVDEDRLYALDLLIKAFIPGWVMGKKFGRTGVTKFQLAWADPFVRAMASEDKEASLARYMRKYSQIMKPLRPFKWKPWDEFELKYTQEGEPKYGNAFHHFAFEVGLAVCAYDLDDSEFRDHPYYPRELVDHYREQLRHTRDSWREKGVGAEVAIEPHAPKKIDLTKSKSKNFKRWVELIGDGNADATKSVTGTFRGLRKISCPSDVFEELAENGIAAFADVKDDETLEASLEALLKDRGVGIYTDPAADCDGGAGRCESLLEHAGNWVEKYEYSLFVADMQADSWGAGLVQKRFIPEFLELSNKLGVSWLTRE
jgi:hypothetical protein